MRKHLILLGLLAACRTFAQQDAQFSQYMFNGMALNPAYAGNKGPVSINTAYRYQWAGIEGAPRTMAVSCDAPLLEKKLGLGLSVINDKLGAQGLFSVFTSYAYRMPVSYNSTLAFGLGLGLSQYTLEGSRISYYEQDDNSALPDLSSDLVPDAKFGLYYSQDNFYTGLSVSNIFANRVSNMNLGQEIVFTTQARHYYLTAGYIAPVSSVLSIYPSILVREDMKGPTNIDMNSFLMYNNLVWFGASYRTSLSLLKKENLGSNLKRSNVVAFIFGINLNEKLRVGYSYDLTTSELRHYNSGSHEISLSYYIPTSVRTRMLTPRYF
jgi:type IX secretion system PorP/SprF family membrane protein